MKKWQGEGLPPCGVGPYWSPGDGKGLNVRMGPDYPARREKCESHGSMYKSLGCYAVKSDEQLEDILERLIHLEDLPSWHEVGGDDAFEWTTDCPLPRIICINLMLPYAAQLNPFWTTPDPGASFVAFFHITPETMRAAMSNCPPPAVNIFVEFCKGPAGGPGGAKDDPRRSLAARLDSSQDKNLQSGIFK
eukprot:CAMPEP_0197695484 /NCGR_PEP_ID=MMETSP1338-20131121/115253_1 /TAXON_ID=43686 ORGANISM="Pelagodinium beii, Strain RCC1491" /NCGR_SAMPLE_ID=MMETSP1338 /ASSEMBLY_ACC=CAM_ASM_000754 /LENGTH=190 /DNA_ID=CAMNT_0043278463 /DNA_START=32 /DNA_END=601 /DNA_ORIENTATION=+